MINETKQIENKKLKIVGIFGYKDKTDLGDFIKEIKTDLTEQQLKVYCERTFKDYKFFSFAWDNGEFPDFMRGIKW